MKYFFLILSFFSLSCNGNGKTIGEEEWDLFYAKKITPHYVKDERYNICFVVSDVWGGAMHPNYVYVPVPCEKVGLDK